VNELDLIRTIQRLSKSPLIGDDCAILPLKAGQNLLVTTDFCIENVHFRRKIHTPFETGWKCLARGLSDIAAMGGDPKWCFVSLALAPWTKTRYLTAFYRGLLKLANRHGVKLAGGDITRAKQLSCDIVVVGTVPAGKALTRSAARPGHSIYVSGMLGRAAAKKFRDSAEPRIELGRWLRSRATACMDLSDGLALDLHRLCLASGVAAEIDGPLPTFPKATLEQALTGGEDYELLFTAQKRLPEFAANVPLTRIGRIVTGKPGSVRLWGAPLPPKGWDPIRG
jgi:thiamine-monophosphate kinase